MSTKARSSGAKKPSKDLLRRAAALLRKSANKLLRMGKCEGFFALDAEGESVFPSSPRATKLCAVGAVCSWWPHKRGQIVLDLGDERPEVEVAITALGRKVCPGAEWPWFRITRWSDSNDAPTVAKVMRRVAAGIDRRAR